MYFFFDPRQHKPLCVWGSENVGKYVFIWGKNSSSKIRVVHLEASDAGRYYLPSQHTLVTAAKHHEAPLQQAPNNYVIYEV